MSDEPGDLLDDLHPFFGRADHFILDDDGEPVPIAIWKRADDPTLPRLIGPDGAPIEMPSLAGYTMDLAALRAWGEAFERNDRIVLQETIGHGAATVGVSTVFLGLDHGHSRRGAPILYETMAFGGVFHNYQNRYRTRLDALRGHQLVVDLVQLYRVAPRRLKKSLAKLGSHVDAWPFAHNPWGRREVRRVQRALARLVGTDPRLTLTP